MAVYPSFPGQITAPSRYEGLNKVFIDGQWRDGRSEKTIDDRDPFTGETLFTFQGANEDDLNEAYETAREAQKGWIALLPMERSAIVRKAADIMMARKEEIADLISREGGGVRMKGEMETQLAHDVTLEALSFPSRVEGRILPCDIPGKENRVYRKPVGVVGVISPWNFPLQLSSRSVAPALAVGNAVVLKPASDTAVTGGTLLGKIYEEAGLPPGSPERGPRERGRHRRRVRLAPHPPRDLLHRIDARRAAHRRAGGPGADHQEGRAGTRRERPAGDPRRRGP